MAIFILLIEDNPADRELAVRALRRLASPPGPAKVTAVGTWAEGIAHLADGHFDLLLLDFNLPDGNGLTMLQELEELAHPPVIMTTGQDDLATAVETLRLGAYDYVQKTADVGPALRLAVTRVLERVKLERELADSRAHLEVYAAELETKVAARTALVRAQAAEIEALYLRTEEAARVRAEIIANLSHELRTPLNTIMGYNDLLADELTGDANDSARTMLQRTRGQVERLRDVVESLLMLAQLRRGVVAANLSRFTCAALLDELRADAVLLNTDKGLEIEWRSPPEHVEIEHDREKIRVIGYHLLSNAIKFTHAGRVVVTIAPQNGGLTLTVVDTGVGLPVEARQFIFEDFRQLDGSSTRRFEGLGLGLGIVTRYTALLDGKLALESTPGVGTTIRIDLPPPNASIRLAENSLRARPRRSQRPGMRAGGATRTSPQR